MRPASSATTVVALAFGVPAAYAISRHRFKQETLLTFWMLVARLALPIGFALPLFNIFVRIGLVSGPDPAEFAAAADRVAVFELTAAGSGVPGSGVPGSSPNPQ